MHEHKQEPCWDAHCAPHLTHHDPAVRELIARAEARGAERVAEIVERTLGMYGFMFVTRGDHAEALRIVRETTRALLAEHRTGTTR